MQYARIFSCNFLSFPRCQESGYVADNFQRQHNCIIVAKTRSRRCRGGRSRDIAGITGTHRRYNRRLFFIGISQGNITSLSESCSSGKIAGEIRRRNSGFRRDRTDGISEICLWIPADARATCWRRSDYSFEPGLWDTRAKVFVRKVGNEFIALEREIKYLTCITRINSHYFTFLLKTARVRNVNCF